MQFLNFYDQSSADKRKLVYAKFFQMRRIVDTLRQSLDHYRMLSSWTEYPKHFTWKLTHIYSAADQFLIVATFAMT